MYTKRRNIVQQECDADISHGKEYFLGNFLKIKDIAVIQIFKEVKNMIVLKMHGGLGNQMFEYAFGKHIQKQLKQDLLLDISDYKQDFYRKFLLNNYSISEKVKIDNTGKYNIIYKNIFIKIGSLICPEILYKSMSLFGVYVWRYATFREIKIREKQKNIYINGYWQSHKYFDDVWNEIKKEFTLKIVLEPEHKRIEEEIKSKNSVCIHIRRGDFLLNTNSLYVSKLSYYEKAINEIKQRYENLEFYVFSDDIDDIKKNFVFFDKSVHLMEGNNPDYIELYLMAQCKHFIISNSTFSWWAANLSDYGKKMVVAPKVWYCDHRDMSHLIRKEWVIIDNE